jgi:hypothetical protein
MKFSSIFIIRIIKSFTWLAFTVFFGLLFPIGAVWLDSSLTTQYFSFNNFLKNGTFMFFAMAVVASITLDHLLSNHVIDKWKKSTFWLFVDLFLFIVFPLLLFVFCVTLFYIPYKEPGKIEFGLLWEIEYYVLLIVFFYGTIVKFNAFKN